MYNHQVRVVETDTYASISQLLGSSGSQKALSIINQWCEATGGGTRFAEFSNKDVLERFNSFYERVLEPEFKANFQVANALGNFRIDAMRPITSVIDLENGIPATMHEAILTFPPMRKLFENGEIQGFGMKPEQLPCEDVWGRLIDNGQVDVNPEIKEGDVLHFEWEYHAGDPIHSVDDIRAVRQTREWIEEFLEKTKYDITDYPNKRGKLKGKKKRT